jgi:uncharacterized damage-inducible protein DinB
MKNLALELVQYHCWATKQVLNHLQTLPRKVLTMSLNSVFPKIESVLVHMLAVDELWFGRMKGSEQNYMEEKSGWPVQQFILAYERLLEDLWNFVYEVEDIHTIVFYTNSEGKKFSNTIFEIIQHIVNHGTYHRGNISAMLRQVGYSTVSTDYIYFLRKK